LFGNSGAEDTLPKDFFALGSVSALGGIPEENAEPPPTAPFRGAFPNEEGAAALDGISPPPPKGLLLSSELLEGALPKEEGDAALGDIPEENAEPPPPAAPFRGAFPNEEGAAAVDGISPPPPKGLLLSSELLEGALPKEEGAAALGGIPEENAEPPPPAAPFRGAFPNEEGAAALGGIPEEPKYR
jgi:hypothetical protein